MDEFISVDEALEMLFDKAGMDEKQKIKRLFQYYSRGKIDFYVELYGKNTRFGLILNQKENIDSPFKLEGMFRMPREYCHDYFDHLVYLEMGGEDKDYDIVTDFDSRGQSYERVAIYQHIDSIEIIESSDGEVYRINIGGQFSFNPSFDEILIKAEQIAELTQSIKPQKKPHKRADITEKSNKTRMEVLGAALSVLAQFRPQCVSGEGVVQGAKVAKVIEDKAGLFWPETNQAPQEPEVLRKTINEWLNKSR